MKKFLFFVTAMVAMVGCDSDDLVGENPMPPVDGGDGEANAVRLRDDANFGSILTDTEGNSLYFFSLDTQDQSLCEGDCLEAWPAFYAEDLTLDEGLDATDFGTITRTDGSPQTTFRGWPLYYFANDNAAGEVNGDGVNDVWYVAKPDYTLMIALSQLVGRDVEGVETELQSDYMPGEEQTMYITDAEGRTLYRFINDTADNNNYTAPDFSNDALWPIFGEELDRIPSILDRADFGVIDVFGRPQLTFKGWPLYYFQFDENRGDNFGVGFPQAGVWPIVNNDTPMAPGAEDRNSVELLGTPNFGRILTDAEGRSLYFFSLDTKDESECEGDCLAAWPAFYAEDLTVGEGLDTADFGSITRTDGSKQTTYKGWPLYYFVEDENPGDTRGDAVNDVWFIAKPDYTLMIAFAQLVGRDVNGVETALNSNYMPGMEQNFYITDDRGNTLYRFINDTNSQNNYTAPDFSNDALWPIFGELLERLPSILNREDFGVIDVHGRPQLTFKGWPMYYFQFDENRGDNFGVGFPQPGVWPILNNDTPVAPEATVMNSVRLLGTPNFGRILADSQGKALYFFSLDTQDQSECEGDCLAAWPAFYAEDLSMLDEGLDAADFGTITRTDGSKQTTYKGWPLYTFVEDMMPFQINGDGVNDVWYVAKPDYSVMIANAQLIGRDVNGNIIKLQSDSTTPGEELTFYITDDRGNTLYRFAPDQNGVNNYTEPDFSNNELWPIYGETLEQIPSILRRQDFGLIDVFGRPQVTFKGWPLYYFQFDENRGDNFGVGFPQPGVWPIVNNDTPVAPAPSAGR